MYTSDNSYIKTRPNCIVGIGASAGGLEALQQFLTFLPSNTGMAFVIIQHLAPNHKSMLADILGKYSAMPVIEIENEMQVERNHVYMIPPKYNVEIKGDVLYLKEYDINLINHLIAIFFRSLAASYENRSVAVILSGTGSDGSNGIRSVKEQNGVIIVQTPESAKFDGMPRNAIATGFVNMIQKPDSIAKEMFHIAASMVDTSANFLLSDQDLMSQVFSILKNVTNINYAYYKQTTILRRIERRLVVTHSRNLQEYVIDYDDVFRALCANEKIFTHNMSGRAPAHEHFGYSMPNVENSLEPVQIQRLDDDSEIQYKNTELDTSVLEALMPACVLVNEKNEMVRSYGDCARFLSIPSGAATLDIFMLIRSDLKIAVSTILRDSRDKDGKVSYDGVPVQLEEQPEYISVIAQPIHDRHGMKTNYTGIAFLRGKRDIEGDMPDYQVDTASSRRISDLEHELKVTKDDLRQTVTELESVNAELQAANEELLTANEELQSSNEELQSVNEELYTVNSEYQSRVNELAGLNDDMANFLSTTLIGILMVDKDLNIHKFTEYIASEFNVADQDIGRPFRYITYNFATVDLMKQCRQVLKTMQPIEQNCASVSGKTYLIRIAPYRAQERFYSKLEGEAAGSGNLQGLVLTFVDTTKQVDDQDQIEEMAKALRMAVKSGQEKETFLSNMSHDMRTPMTAIAGLTALSLQEPDLPEAIRDNLEKIQTSSNYLLRLIEEILESSRINAGKVVTVSTAVKEEDLLSSVQTITNEQVRLSGLEFEMNTHGLQNKYVLMDVPHVERILMNLLSNSIKYTPQGGKITLDVDVSYKNGKAEHTYIVWDTGIGISDSFQQKMFLPFEQDNAEERYHDGTGLGLYICKHLVELPGGTIVWESKLGIGTKFVVNLAYNLATDEQIALQTHRAETYEDQVLYGKNVLLAEDNLINTEVIIKILGTKGIHAELACDGQEAVDLFESHRPYHYQAILMDLMMPIKNGDDAAKEIRALPGSYAADVPIIALTADVTDNVDEKCQKAGINYCVSKPLDTNLLFNILTEEFQKQINS